MFYKNLFIIAMNFTCILLYILYHVVALHADFYVLCQKWRILLDVQSITKDKTTEIQFPCLIHLAILLLYPRPTKLEGGYTGFTLSVCPSVRLSVDDMVSGA